VGLFLKPIKHLHARLKAIAEVVIERHLADKLLLEQANHLTDSVATDPTGRFLSPVVEPDFDVSPCWTTLFCRYLLG
jgi:hypothetical protein